MYIEKNTLKNSLNALYGTAGHLLKIWLVLKKMGLAQGAEAIEIDTSNSKPSLDRLFSCGSNSGDFYVPFAHTPRYLKMKHDASRSIVQTTIQRWGSSGSVVTCDPTQYLNISQENSKLAVKTGRQYPMGLGIGESGFALDDETRVSLPLRAFAVWYGRNTEIPSGIDPEKYLIDEMLADLHISSSERNLIFVEDDLEIKTQDNELTNEEIYECCESFLSGNESPSVLVYKESQTTYTRKVNSMVSRLDLPAWMRTSPEEELHNLIKDGRTAILILGPPRTGKTRVIDSIVSRSSSDRETIQIHDGWGYENLIEGFMPDAQGNWDWKPGPLKEAIESGKEWIVLEEINRTSISQSLGEVFSLIEDSYRGEDNSITTRSGKPFYIPEDVTFLMTMNTIDKSTEDVDDALIGRVSVVEFPARSEDLVHMLQSLNIAESLVEKISQLFSEIQEIYPLGHGYFSGLTSSCDNQFFLRYYKSRIRPVLFNFLGELQSAELDRIDNLVDEMFGIQ
ncbi:AAA family ATPase [Salinimonas chungwhensis]|uniref:AAA family ATPase n=1 Tax=Salinimonas chungwhensis TaxID=265425 RepID=UPI00037083AB|nr:AAA family ATPase [Salinimonas chungwhensis]